MISSHASLIYRRGDFSASSNEDSFINLYHIMLFFGIISGLNRIKNLVIGINYESSKSNNWASFYLGFPLGHNPKQASFWRSVLDEVQKCLLSGERVLFFEGRLTLFGLCLEFPC